MLDHVSVTPPVIPEAELHAAVLEAGLDAAAMFLACPGKGASAARIVGTVRVFVTVRDWVPEPVRHPDPPMPDAA